VFPSRRKIVLVSGCFWHGHHCGRCRLPASNRNYWIAKIERNKRRDQQARRALRRLGWDVLTIWECNLRDMAGLKRRVLAFLD
jgi:DNA mismatch endonuclease (patch repair protein)